MFFSLLKITISLIFLVVSKTTIEQGLHQTGMEQSIGRDPFGHSSQKLNYRTNGASQRRENNQGSQSEAERSRQRQAGGDFDLNSSIFSGLFICVLQLLPADLRSACYKTVLRAGGQKEFDTLLKLYRSTDLHEEKDR